MQEYISYYTFVDFYNNISKVVGMFGFKQKKKQPEIHLPIQRGFYAWNFLHAGSFLLYIESLNGYHQFMFLPGPSDFFLTTEDFSQYLKNGTLSIVDQLPLEVFQEAMKYSLPCPTNPPIVTTNEIQNQEN